MSIKIDSDDMINLMLRCKDYFLRNDIGQQKTDVDFLFSIEEKAEYFTNPIHYEELNSEQKIKVSRLNVEILDLADQAKYSKTIICADEEVAIDPGELEMNIINSLSQYLTDLSYNIHGIKDIIKFVFGSTEAKTEFEKLVEEHQTELQSGEMCLAFCIVMEKLQLIKNETVVARRYLANFFKGYFTSTYHNRKEASLRSKKSLQLMERLLEVIIINN